MTKKYTRTDKDFIVESIAGLKEVIQKHTIAGFEHIPDSIVYRRFFQLIKLLQDNNLTVRTLYIDQSDLNDQTELRNSDLNDKGFYFCNMRYQNGRPDFTKIKVKKKKGTFLRNGIKRLQKIIQIP